jgi:hypothetical protein
VHVTGQSSRARFYTAALALRKHRERRDEMHHSLSALEFNPAFVEAIEHLNAGCGVLHALRLEQRLPSLAWEHPVLGRRSDVQLEFSMNHSGRKKQIRIGNSRSTCSIMECCVSKFDRSPARRWSTSKPPYWDARRRSLIAMLRLQPVLRES